MKKERRGFGPRISRGLKSVDIFGHPITLQYKNDTEYKSAMGGFMTVIVMIGLLTYCII